MLLPRLPKAAASSLIARVNVGDALIRWGVDLPANRVVGWIQHHQLYSSAGADIVMESITPLRGDAMG